MHIKSKVFRSTILLLILLFAVSTVAVQSTMTVNASGTFMPVSLGLETISYQNEMVKSGLVYGNISFTASDFDRAVGISKVKSITVTSIPEISDGSLMLGNVNVYPGQVISRANMELLKFVPSQGDVAQRDAAQGGAYDCSFTFNAGSAYDIECILRMTNEVNFAPTVSLVDTSLGGAVSVWTQKDICSFGSLSASDPEGDELVFEITNSSKKGIVVLTDKNHGDFKYTPYAGCSGSDRFTYVVRDEYGNYSEEATVTVKIVRPEADIVFSDMEKDKDWAYNAALVMTARGIMSCPQINGAYTFNPNGAVTRSEFLVMVMTALGADSIPTVATTGFADDSDIPASAKGYAASALKLGIVKGDTSQSGLTYFHPNDPITRAEAAVILNNIIGAPIPTSVPVFSDSSAVPAWAQNALYAMNDLGIMKGTGSGFISPSSTLNRAQTAQILFSMLNIVNGK